MNLEEFLLFQIADRTQLNGYSTIWYIGDSIHDLNPSMRRPVDFAHLKAKQVPLTAAKDKYLSSSFAELANFSERVDMSVMSTLRDKVGFDS